MSRSGGSPARVGPGRGGLVSPACAQGSAEIGAPTRSYEAVLGLRDLQGPSGAISGLRRLWAAGRSAILGRLGTIIRGDLTSGIESITL